MSPRSALVVAGLLLAAGGFAGGGALRAEAAAPWTAVRWLAPAHGAVWVAGGRAELAWEPGAEFAALGAVEEWETFLSVDGGRTWAVRLTPHLDLDRRRVTIEVPELPSADARLLLRVGDERVETEVPVPVRLRIEPPPAGRVAWRPPVALAFARGERARAGAAGVRLWAAGGRRDAAVRWYQTAAAAAGLRPLRWEGAAPALLLAPAAEARPRLAPPAAISPRLRARPLRAAIGAAAPPRTATQVDPLLAGCRRNT